MIEGISQRSAGVWRDQSQTRDGAALPPKALESRERNSKFYTPMPYVGIVPPKSKVSPRVVHRRYAKLQRFLSARNFTLEWATNRILQVGIVPSFLPSFSPSFPRFLPSCLDYPPAAQDTGHYKQHKLTTRALATAQGLGNWGYCNKGPKVKFTKAKTKKPTTKNLYTVEPYITNKCPKKTQEKTSKTLSRAVARLAHICVQQHLKGPKSRQTFAKDDQ